MDGPILTIIVVAVVLAAVTAARVVTRNRRVGLEAKQLTAWAGRHGWSYAMHDHSIERRFEGTPFVGGVNGGVRHVLSGRHRGRAVLAFQYQYTTKNTADSQTSMYRITAVQTPERTPFLEVAEEHFGHKVLGAVGIHDLQLSDPDFNDAFRIQSEDDDFARAALTPELMRRLVSDPRTVPFRFAGGYLLTWEEGPMEIGTCVDRADFLLDLLDQVPADLWSRPRQH